jgi:hypothetical protein
MLVIHYSEYKQEFFINKLTILKFKRIEDFNYLLIFRTYYSADSSVDSDTSAASSATTASTFSTIS